MLDMDQYENAALEIIARGWAYLDCPSNCDPERVLDLAPAFFGRRRADWRQWCAVRPGESESDVGMKISTSDELNHSGVPKDNKAHLMYAHDMQQLIKEQHGVDVLEHPEDAEFLSLIGDIHMAGQWHAFGLLTAISRVLGLRDDLAAANAYAQKQLLPWAVDATRIMQFFKDGGKPHIDRNIITPAHWGDRGGELFAVDHNGKEHVVSPPEGKVLAFASLKLEVATQGRVKAVPHGSYCSATNRRLALVTFAQIATVPQVIDYQQAYDHGLENYKVVTV